MLKEKNNKFSQSKHGAASLYIVIFTTLILSIISISYVQIMLSNARQTSNMDLSQSAYDSALAGVEDAKLALLKYHDCLNKGTPGPGSVCEGIINAMQSGIANKSCDVVRDVLSRNKTGAQGETLIIEQSNATTTTQSSQGMDQAYTCVKIREELADYRTTLDGDENRVRVIPLRTDDPASIKAIRISWHSAINHGTASTIGLDVYQTDQSYSLGELSAASADGTDHVRLLLTPDYNSSDAKVKISSVNVLKQAHKSTDNKPFKIKCSEDNASGFECSVLIGIPAPFSGNAANRAKDTFTAKVSLPGGGRTTDISIALCKDYDENNCVINGNTGEGGSSVQPFYGVQAMIDSTGRANDLFRRVEARIELVDNYYNFPEFEIQLDGEDKELKKNFWVMKNCWRLDGKDGEKNKNKCKNNPTDPDA